ncbi:MAG: ATP-binding protein, partial [Bacteroidota bacterium]
LHHDQAESREDNLKTLHFSANHLLSLVNDILDFSKLDAGKVSFEQVEFDLQLLCKNLHKTFSQQAAEKQLDLNLNAPALSTYVKGDIGRLNQILNNLIGNAIKFTSEGSVQTRYEIVSDHPEHLDIRFSIRDTGIGIPLEKHDSVFQQFEQASSDTTRKFGGTGLGLAICKKLVELQGGEIGLISQEGEGTTFWFHLQFEKGKTLSTEDAGKAILPDWKSKTLPGMKVLLVEDNIINRKIGSKFLKKWDIEIELAENGQIALDKLTKQPEFDLVLMDLNMPVMGGIEATSIIRSKPDAPFRNIPIIALTADVSPDVKERTLASGMNDYLTKPLDPERLFAVLEREYVRRGRTQSVSKRSA